MGFVAGWILFMIGIFVLALKIDRNAKARYKKLGPHFEKAKNSLYKGMSKDEVIKTFSMFKPKKKRKKIIYELPKRNQQWIELRLFFDNDDKLYDYESSEVTIRRY